jgi:hypothetical protein
VEIVLITFLCSISVIWADDVDVNLNSKNGTTGFVIRNNNTTPDSLLKVKSNGDVGLKPGQFINYMYGTPNNYGSGGYGFWDDNGTLKYKNRNGAWAAFGYVDNDVNNPYGYGSGTYTYGQMYYDHGAPDVNLAYPNKPTISLPKQSTGYTNLFPMTTIPSGTPYGSVANGDVHIDDASGNPVTTGQPILFHITGAGVYRVSASIAVYGDATNSFEIEVFKQTGGPVSWSTGTHDIESLSTAVYVTTAHYASGAFSGIVTTTGNDYLALMGRSIDSSETTHTQKVICINFNVERIK